MNSHAIQLRNFFQLCSFPKFDVNVFWDINPFKDFQSDQMQRSSRKIFTTHFACMNADSNLTPVTGTTNPGLTDSFFQIVNSLIESFGLKLTCLGCKRWILYVLLFYLQYRPVQTDATRNRCSKHRWSWLLTSIPESRNTNTGKQIWMSRNSQSIKIGIDKNR